VTAVQAVVMNGHHCFNKKEALLDSHKLNIRNRLSPNFAQASINNICAKLGKQKILLGIY